MSNLSHRLATFQAWTSVLRAGIFKQGKGRLCTIPATANAQDITQWRMCCLGVVCALPGSLAPMDLLAWESGTDDAGNQRLEAIFKFANYDKSSAYMPEGMADFLGMDKAGSLPTHLVIDEPDGFGYTVDISHSQDNSGGWSLAVLNDAGLPFPQIADVIQYFWINDLEREIANERQRIIAAAASGDLGAFADYPL